MESKLISKDDLYLKQPLYESDKGKIFYHDFVNTLRQLGVREGDAIFVHSDISVFGKLCLPDRNFLFNALIDLLMECVGNEGTLIMPTFTYSFCNASVYDVEESRSSVGALTEYFRMRSDVKRTDHPIFSVAICGKKRDEFIKTGKDSFDEESIFGKLHKVDGKIVMLGSPFVSSCTFLHHVEQMHCVPYRFVKGFKGVMRKEGREYEDQCTYLVRRLDRDVVMDKIKIEKHLLSKGLLKLSALGNGNIMMIDTEVMYREGIRMLEEDINSFLVGS